MTDQTLVKQEEMGETKPCGKCRSTDHPTGYHDNSPTGYHDNSVPEESDEK